MLVRGITIGPHALNAHHKNPRLMALKPKAALKPSSRGSKTLVLVSPFSRHTLNCNGTNKALLSCINSDTPDIDHHHPLHIFIEPSNNLEREFNLT